MTIMLSRRLWVSATTTVRSSNLPQAFKQNAIRYHGLSTLASWRKVRGPCAATLTPMNKDGSINTDLCGKYVDHLVNTGVKGVFVNGTSGESLSLTIEERKLIAESWVENGKDRLDAIIIHCGAEGLEAAKELAKHAQSIGADAIGAMCPSFFKPEGTEGIVQYLKAIADSAPNLPFFYYHFPLMNGVYGSFEQILRRSWQTIPNLAGGKFTAYELDDAMGATFVDPNLEIFLGFDSIILGGLAMGIESSIGTEWNVMGKAWHRLNDAFQSGDFKKAREVQLGINKFYGIITKHDSLHYNPTHKAVMKMFGMDFGPSRLPISNISESTSAAIRRSLKDAGFYKFIEVSSSKSTS